MKILLNSSLLFCTWLVFSQRFDLLHLSLGVLCSLIVALTCNHLIFRDQSIRASVRLKAVLHFPYYALWLMYQIIYSNIFVLYLSLHPRMKEIIDPCVIRFRSEHLKGEFAHFVMAHSITLTPGTVTMLLEDNEFTVHSLTARSSDGLPSPMDLIVAYAFNLKE